MVDIWDYTSVYHYAHALCVWPFACVCVCVCLNGLRVCYYHMHSIHCTCTQRACLQCQDLKCHKAFISIQSDLVCTRQLIDVHNNKFNNVVFLEYFWVWFVHPTNPLLGITEVIWWMDIMSGSVSSRHNNACMHIAEGVLHTQWHPKTGQFTIHMMLNNVSHCLHLDACGNAMQC